VERIGRRTFLAATSFLPLAAVMPRELLLEHLLAGQAAPRALNAHEFAVVEAATARLIPGPADDPAEAGHPGAREANVARYIDTMLGALNHAPPRVFAGGPFSNRSGAHIDDMARFLRLDDVERIAWKERLASLQRRYVAGVQALDNAAGGDFAGARPDRQDTILATDPEQFTTLLMQHAIEGMYTNPEYGGNAGLVGWKDIAFPGDSQPKGYTANQVRESDGKDPADLTPVVRAALNLITSTAPLKE
jgi:hypothetical protein